MIDVGEITKGIETLLNEKTTGFTIQRAGEINRNPNVAGRNNGWIGIFKGASSYKTHTTGNTPWLADIAIEVHVQRSSSRNGAVAEDGMTDSEKLVMDVLANKANLSLNGTVDTVIEFDVEYKYEKEDLNYFATAIITLVAQKRT